MSKVTSFFREVKEEIQKTDFPSGKELRKDSATIFSVLIFFSIFFFVADWLINIILY